MFHFSSPFSFVFFCFPMFLEVLVRLFFGSLVHSLRPRAWCSVNVGRHQCVWRVACGMCTGCVYVFVFMFVFVSVSVSCV